MQLNLNKRRWWLDIKSSFIITVVIHLNQPINQQLLVSNHLHSFSYHKWKYFKESQRGLFLCLRKQTSNMTIKAPSVIFSNGKSFVHHFPNPKMISVILLYKYIIIVYLIFFGSLLIYFMGVGSYYHCYAMADWQLWWSGSGRMKTNYYVEIVLCIFSKFLYLKI